MIKLKRNPEQAAQIAPQAGSFAAGPPLESQSIKSPIPAQNAPQRQIKPFTGIDEARKYRPMYRAACDFHERHNPPRLDDPEQYWIAVADDMGQTAAAFDNDRFVVDLLTAIYGELEAEYKALEDRN